MKRIRAIFLSFLLVLSLVLCLAACGGSKLPTNDYEKVKFAFNGVEKSFKNAKKSSKASNNQDFLKMLSFNPSDNDLNTIKSCYSSDDNQGNIIDDLEYDEPPMIQFQYIKKVLEKVGSNYSFNTKYYDQIDGKVYIDIDKGKKMEGNNDYKYNYNFILSIDINIDSNDLINADVSFDITLKKDSRTIKTNWYVNIILDYDMKNTTPNYTMTMLTNNDEKELPTRNGYTYEYDYVEVKDNKINEWRKFCFESDTKLVKDSTHTSFDDYINKDVVFDSSTCKWYHDNSLYKLIRKDSERDKIIAKAFFNMGLNDTDIDGSNFINKESMKNGVIKTCYSEFSKIAKEDILYSMITAEERHDINDQITGIDIRNNDSTGHLDNINTADRQLGELVKNFKDVNDEDISPQVYYVDSNGGLKGKANVDMLDYYFAIDGETYEEIAVSKGQTISQAYASYMEKYNITNPSTSFRLIIKDKEKNVSGYAVYIYSGEMPEVASATFPSELESLGLPTYEGTNARYNLLNEDGNKKLEITYSNNSEAKNYETLLVKKGFTNLNIDTANMSSFKKETSSSIIYVDFDYRDESKFILKVIIDTEAVRTISVVGVNNWELTGGFEFSKETDKYTLNGLSLSANDKFKIVINHSWDGCLGYNEIDDFSSYSELFTTDSDGNVVVINGCTLSLEAFADGGGFVSVHIKTVTAI